MGANAVIYGAIDGPWPQSDPAVWRRMNRHNRRVLGRLPDTDRYPPLVRRMFGVTDRRGLFWMAQVIHFGWSAKNFAQHWPEWREKFEGLLRRLVWVDARVHIEVEYEGELTCRWVIRPESVQRWSAGELPTPDNEWEFSSTGGLC
jgi:hypothetical protein